MAHFTLVSRVAEEISPVVIRTDINSLDSGCLEISYADRSADIKLLDPTVKDLDTMIAHLTKVRMELWKRAIARGEEI